MSERWTGSAQGRNRRFSREATATLHACDRYRSDEEAFWGTLQATDAHTVVGLKENGCIHSRNANGLRLCSGVCDGRHAAAGGTDAAFRMRGLTRFAFSRGIRLIAVALLRRIYGSMRSSSYFLLRRHRMTVSGMVMRHDGGR